MTTIVDMTHGATVSSEGELNIKTSCRDCNGTGLRHMKLDVKTLVDIYQQFPDNKIQRIKELRSTTYLGLRSAKQVIEAYDKLLKELTEISYS